MLLVVRTHHVALMAGALAALACSCKTKTETGSEPAPKATSGSSQGAPVNPELEPLAAAIAKNGWSFRDKPNGPELARAFAPFYRERVGELPALAASLRAFANDASRPMNARLIVATYALYDGITDDWVSDTEPGSYGKLDDWVLLELVWLMVQPTPPADLRDLEVKVDAVLSALPLDKAASVWNDALAATAYAQILAALPESTLQATLAAVSSSPPPPQWRPPAAPPAGSKRWDGTQAGVISSQGSTSMMLFEDGSSIVSNGTSFSVND